ncbi:MAG: hypothetical protein JRE70_17390, partial [Deltaproteobacteria bacterium]|nr:hypothetical protein [Deltaproteobacteria bacterium]
MSWIRSWGLGVFVALIAVWLLFVWLLLDWLVERAIEETGTEIVGARVELDAAEVGFAPLSITLHRLQVTDPDEPMRNAFEL